MGNRAERHWRLNSNIIFINNTYSLYKMVKELVYFVRSSNVGPVNSVTGTVYLLYYSDSDNCIQSLDTKSFWQKMFHITIKCWINTPGSKQRSMNHEWPWRQSKFCSNKWAIGNTLPDTSLSATMEQLTSEPGNSVAYSVAKEI